MPYPLGAWTQVEGGGQNQTSGDRHTVTVDGSTCKLYETFATRRQGSQWSAGSGAVWNLNAYRLRPNGWTSADAAGLPILPLCSATRKCRRATSTTPSASPPR